MSAIQIGPLTFRTKKAAKEYFRSIRDSYPDGTQLSPEDAAHVYALVSCHPEAEGKIGCGVSHFTVDVDSVFGTTRHLTLHRIDGSSTDFSFLTCIDGRNIRKDKLEALRREVEDQIITFRTATFESGPVICPFLQVELTPSASHVDHTPPNTFMKIVEDWLNTRQLQYDDIEITPPQDNQIVTNMTNQDQKRDWAEHHRKAAILRVLSPLGNLSHAKKQGKQDAQQSA